MKYNIFPYTLKNTYLKKMNNYEIKMTLEFHIQEKENTKQSIFCNKDTICSICHDNVNEYYKSCCGQYYHIECMYEWLKYHNKCPICKINFKNYLKYAMKTWIKAKTQKEREQIRWNLIFLPEESFCSICFYSCDENISCDGYRYHIDCIKNYKYCPECDVELSNETIYKIWKNNVKDNYFHNNYLNHILVNRKFYKGKRIRSIRSNAINSNNSTSNHNRSNDDIDLDSFNQNYGRIGRIVNNDNNNDETDSDMPSLISMSDDDNSNLVNYDSDTTEISYMSNV